MPRIPLDAPIVIEDAPAPPTTKLTIPGLLRLDLSARRRILVCGDIHGCFDLLDARLAELAFDPAQDALISLGDLIDRGPDSPRALEFLGRPGVWAVRGNHEQILLDAWANPDDDLPWRDLVSNGGAWFTGLPETGGPREITQQAFSEAFASLPIAIEATTPGGRTIGIVHAGVPGNSWRNVRELPAEIHANPKVFEDNRTRDHALADHMVWDRSGIQDALRFAHLGHNPAEFPPVTGIDHVFHGHNIVRRPVRLGNTTWLDTRRMDRQQHILIGTIMNDTDTIDRPPVSEPPSLPPFLCPKRRGGGRWIIMPDICRGDQADRIPDRANNWYTIIWRWMVRIDSESGAIAGVTHTSTRTYRKWLETYHSDSGIPPHIGFGGAIVAGEGDPTFHPRWQDYARATFT